MNAKRHIPWLTAVALALTLAGTVWGGAIKSWTTGETLRSADLNTNFEHLHNTMVGGHGARLVNADVSTTAAIAHSKFASPGLVPKTWVYISAVCNASPCTIGADVDVTDVTRSGVGVYQVNFTSTKSNANYAMLVSYNNNIDYNCVGDVPGTANMRVSCFNTAGAAADGMFSVLIMDDNN